MTEHNVYLGSVGPYIYDDADVYGDGHVFEVLYSSTGRISVAGASVSDAPTNPGDVVRIDDFPGGIPPAGHTGWFDDGVNFRVTVTNGVITSIGNSIAGGWA